MFKESKLDIKSRMTKFTSESSDLSIISSDSSAREGSCLSRFHSDKPKGDDFSDEEFENLFKNYKMEVNTNNYLTTYKRSLSESGQFRNYTIKETPSSDEESPGKRPIRASKFFSAMKKASGVKPVNKSYQSYQDNDFSLVNIVKNLAFLEKNMDKSSKSGKRKIRRSKPKSKKSTFITTIGKYNLNDKL
mmetsp:Transcript_18392/g.20567  ORF Transcript_18392/g.20567 Transcript_18392/m.20567 type:complete len:190 (-) Transcript_18392:108-677(-)